MAATKPADQFRLELEEILTCVVVAEEHLRVALILFAQWARTDYELNIITEIIGARQAHNKARDLLLEFHENKRDEF